MAKVGDNIRAQRAALSDVFDKLLEIDAQRADLRAEEREILQAAQIDHDIEPRLTKTLYKISCDKEKAREFYSKLSHYSDVMQFDLFEESAGGEDE